jgi:hypothetical protein
MPFYPPDTFQHPSKHWIMDFENAEVQHATSQPAGICGLTLPPFSNKIDYGLVAISARPAESSSD